MATKRIQDASFNPRIKSYLFVIFSVVLTVSMIGIPLLIIWLLGWGKYYTKRYYENLSCTLTEKNLSFKKGVFFRVEKTIPLDNIQDLTFVDNPILRYFDLRMLKIETAGNSSDGSADMSLIGIIDAMKFRDLVIEQRDLLSNNASPSGETQPGTEPSETVVLLREIRDLLKANNPS